MSDVKKAEIIVMVAIPVELKPEHYPTDNPDEMLRMDIAAIDEDPFAVLDAERNEWVVYGRMLEDEE